MGIEAMKSEANIRNRVLENLFQFKVNEPHFYLSKGEYLKWNLMDAVCPEGAPQHWLALDWQVYARCTSWKCMHCT